MPLRVLILALSLSPLIVAREGFAAQACSALSFKAAPNYPVGTNPLSVAAGDFNNDGNRDLAVVYASHPENVAILLGAGGGKLGEAYRFDGGTALYVVVADFNKDAKQDLALVGDGVRVLFGTGDGRFSAGGTFGAGFTTVSPVVADFNGDGKLDVAVVNAVTSTNNAALLLGDGAGNFGPASFFPAGTFPYHVVTSDFNGDGRPDLAVTNPNARVVSVLLNNAAGGFGQPTDHAAAVTALVTGDFDQDGKADVAGVYHPTNVAGVLFGDGAGGFSRQLTFPTGGTPYAVAAADLNGDQIGDLAVANNGSGDVSVVLGEGGGAFTAATNYAVGNVASTAWVVAGDFNRDGRPDLVATDSTRNRAALMLNTGAGQFAAPSYFDVAGGAPSAAAAGDFNRDGDLDLVFTLGGPTGVSILLGNGAGRFAAVGGGPINAIFVTTTDFNRDGNLDLALVNRSPHSVSVMLGNGAGGFGSTVNFAVGIAPTAAAAGDLNGDGNPDLVVANYDTNNLTVLLGDGAGGVASTANLPTARHPNFVAVNDFNGDGKADLAVTYEDPSKLGVLLGDGAGGFSAAGEYAVGIFPNNVAAGDLNGDGRIDLLALNSVSNTVSALLGDGAGGFSAAGLFGVGAGPRTLVLADFNGDSRPDIAAANQASGNVTVILSAPCPAAVGTIGFGAASHSVGEGAGRAVLTVTRAGDANGAASVDYRTTDADTFTVGCADAAGAGGSAYARCDFATAAGTISFADGETSKTITVPIIDDAHVEGPETFQLRLTNVAGAALGALSVTTVTISDNDSAGARNPVLGPPHDFFVRQQYLDFLSREPEQGGFNAWLGVLNGCLPDAFTGPQVRSGCDRIHVSGEGFFRSPEFALKGAYAFRFYKAVFGRLPEYAEITSDMSFVAGATADEVFARRAELAVRFTERQEFRNSYGAMTNAQYVAALLSRYGLQQITAPDPAAPDTGGKVVLTNAELINRLNADTLTRAQVLRAVADSDEVGTAEFNNAFVAMQYYGYLRRMPEPGGYDAWLRVISEDPNNIRQMVDGFLNSQEYRLRFGQP
jgi:hypothetical protein